MTKEQIETILWKLKDMEWKLHYVDNGPDEYRCPGHCCAPKFKNEEPAFFKHLEYCDYRNVLETLQNELSCLELIEYKEGKDK